jgi:hypothetical protein
MARPLERIFGKVALSQTRPHSEVHNVIGMDLATTTIYGVIPHQVATDSTTGAVRAQSHNKPSISGEAGKITESTHPFRAGLGKGV